MGGAREPWVRGVRRVTLDGPVGWAGSSGQRRRWGCLALPRDAARDAAGVRVRVRVWVRVWVRVRVQLR